MQFRIRIIQTGFHAPWTGESRVTRDDSVYWFDLPPDYNSIQLRPGGLTMSAADYVRLVTDVDGSGQIRFRLIFNGNYLLDYRSLPLDNRWHIYPLWMWVEPRVGRTRPPGSMQFIGRLRMRIEYPTFPAHWATAVLDAINKGDLATARRELMLGMLEQQ